MKHLRLFPLFLVIKINFISLFYFVSNNKKFEKKKIQHP